MPSRFGYYNNDHYWSPEYGDIDWSLLAQRLEAAGELEAYESVGFDSGDGLVEELHQENFTIRTNEADPNMDMVAVGDPRDGKDFVYFRDEQPEQFEEMVRIVGRAALRLHSRFPLEDTVMIYLERKGTGIDPGFLEQPHD